jgi:DNA-directed RNA polymerase specialized sigma24 family protein
MPQPPPTGSPASTTAGPSLLALAPALYRTARRLTQRADDAAAVTVEAVREAHRECLAGGVPSRGRVFAALWQALAARWQRDGYVPPPMSTRTAEAILAERLGDDDAELDGLMMSRLDASPDVDVALRRLGERERFVVLLVDVEDVPIDEAAEALGTEAGTLCRWLLTARALIFVTLADYAQRPGGGEPRRG